MARAKKGKSVKPKIRLVLNKDGSTAATAEDRWNLSGRLKPETPNIPNEHLILDMASSMGRSRNEITEALLLFPRNVDCILERSQRLAVCEWLGISEPTEAERVQYINEQVARSSGDGAAWSSLLDGKKIVNLAIYHELRYKRLDEQVGRGLNQEKGRRARHAIDGPGASVGAMLPSQIVGAIISRDATGMDGMDTLGGRDKVTGKYGWEAGTLILVGGEPGVGKTKIALAMAASSSSPQSDFVALYNQGEFPLSIFKTKYCDGVLKGDESIYLSDKRALGDILDMMYKLRPRFVFIDSKDKINECETLSGWKRAEKRLRSAAMEIGATIFLISHLNGQGGIRGGRSAEYDVDAVMHIRKIPEAKLFEVCMSSKNRGGPAELECKSIFRHMNDTIICVQEAPRYRVVGGMIETVKNPLLLQLPSVVEEESLEKEEAALLDKISVSGMVSLTIEEKERLGHITGWKIFKSSPAYKKAMKAQQKSEMYEDAEEEDPEDEKPDEDEKPKRNKDGML